MTRKEQERQEAIEQLRAMLPVGSRVCTILRHVSRSGMTRHVSVITEDSADITYLVARAIGERRHARDGGIVMGGCGTDMGFELVYQLSYALYPDGFVCIGEGCPANDHSNGDRDYTPHQHSKGAGAYAIRQRWL